MATIKEGSARTHSCGQLSAINEGESVVLCGWVKRSRNLGGLYFIDLRDKYGLTQLNFEGLKKEAPQLKECHLESVIKVWGKVRKRPPEAVNKKMATGEIEVVVEKMELLSPCAIDSLPFLPDGKIEATEQLRLKYRYLDLRSQRLQNILKRRSATLKSIRDTLVTEDFIEVETPILYKSTPEGARDYIVPSRLHPHLVYALPQSPQMLKQLLMMGGTDKYFQLCRCFRDEDPRADRQPEFTQIDIEASFVGRDYIKRIVERLMANIFGFERNFTIKQMNYRDAMRDYGSDKPDLRFALKHKVVTDIFKDSSFRLFSSLAHEGGLIKLIHVPGHFFSRKETDHFNSIVAPHGGDGVASFKTQEGVASGGISKFITAGMLERLGDLGEKDGTWLFVGHRNHDSAHACADALRRHLGVALSLLEKGYRFLWVDNFPLLEWNPQEGRFFARHHPFTAPKLERREDFFEADHGKLLTLTAKAYDVVCNGYELGGGSERIHERRTQERMFQILGMEKEDIERQFGPFIEALDYGSPPHAGVALGLDRIVMLLVGSNSLRDVIAFPKTTHATDVMSGTPSQPSPQQLEQLHMAWVERKDLGSRD